ncbi:PREDICTED: cytidine deaminase-like [Bactrocera latifrons]|uniref:Cytidine deaminase n=1 Tax=Bactrocera latifrons TaxID=174628 RepID=A0A0K8W1U1_BACLA|nr:PREDICTED: cytidine deaminase-like [Bactrocera latifrons]
MPRIIVYNTNADKQVRDFKELAPDAQELIRAAIEARRMAYCPYSKFQVGAAIQTGDGSIYTGCNIENGAYPAGICAERTAACKAVSDGKRDFVACAVVAQQESGFTTPCGVCRQFLAEFAMQRDFPLYCAKPACPPLHVLVTSIRDLLPRSFSFLGNK